MEPSFLTDDFESLNSEQIYYYKQLQKKIMDFGGTLYKTHSVSLSLLTHKMGISPLSSGNTEVLDVICKRPNISYPIADNDFKADGVRKVIRGIIQSWKKNFKRKLSIICTLFFFVAFLHFISLLNKCVPLNLTEVDFLWFISVSSSSPSITFQVPTSGLSKDRE